MANPKPYVQVASVCERVLQEPDNVLTAVRLVDVLTLSEVTVALKEAPPDAKQVEAVQIMDLWILVALKAGDLVGDFRFSLQMRDPKDRVVPIATELPVSLKAEGGVNFKLRFGLPFNAPEGMYWFEVLWNGKELTRFPLRLKRAEADEEAQAKPH